MALPTVSAENVTGADIGLSRIGLVVPALTTVVLTNWATYFECCTDETLIAAVTAGNIVINDGTQDLTVAEGLAYLDAAGNLNGPVTGAAVGKMLRLTDSTGRFTEAVNARMYDPAAVNPGAGVDGDMYYNTALNMWMYYDGARGKWLSIDSNTLQTGNQGNTPVGTYFRGVSGNLLGASAGYTTHFNGTVVGVSWTRSNVLATNFHLMANGAQIGAVASAAVKGYANNVNADFAQDDVLAVRNDGAGNMVRDAQVWLWIKWRV